MQGIEHDKRTTQTDIARELGLSKAAVSKLKARGMPCTSADAARRWRAAHLVPSRVRADPGPSDRTRIERAHELRDLALMAHQIGRFELVAEALRSALRDVPDDHRPAVRMAPWLWRELAGRSTWAQIVDESGHPAPWGTRSPGREAVPVPAGWYMLACGELQP